MSLKESFQSSIWPSKKLVPYHCDEADKPHKDMKRNSSPFIEMALVLWLLRNSKYALEE